MPARCLLEIDGVPHSLEVEDLHHRRFRGEGAALHVHPSYHLVLVAAGACRLRLPDRADQAVGEGGLVVIDPLVPHAFVGDPVRGVEHACLIWRFRNREGGYALQPLLRLAGVDEQARAGATVLRLDRAAARDFVQRQRAAEAAWQSGSLFAASMHAFELLFMGLALAAPRTAPARPADRAGDLVARVKAAIEQDLADPGLGVARIARRVGLNPSYLSGVFREREGLPVGQYIIHRRVALAKAMLAEAGCGVADAARLAGFNQHSYFARVFRRLCGMSPTAWRDQAARAAQAG